MNAPRILPILANLDDIAESIAEPPTRRPFANAVGQAGRKVCDRLSANGGNEYNGDVLRGALVTICTPYWNEQGYSEPVAAPPPFQGGQCPVNYNVSVVRQSNGQVVSGSPSTLAGPVTGFTVIDDGPGPSGTLKKTFTFTSAGGNSTASVFVPPASPGLTPQVVRADGQPDNCGNLPVGDTYQPGPTPAPDPGPLDPDEQPVDDPVFGPGLPVGPVVTLPGLPDIRISPNPFSNPVPGDPGEPGDSVETGPSGAPGGLDEAEGTAPPGTELVGLKLDLVSALQGSRQYGDNIWRGGAYIRMGTVAGLDQDFGGAQIESGQFFFAEREGLTKWRVTANVGYKWNVTPYYREV